VSVRKETRLWVITLLHTVCCQSILCLHLREDKVINDLMNEKKNHWHCCHSLCCAAVKPRRGSNALRAKINIMMILACAVLSATHLMSYITTWFLVEQCARRTACRRVGTVRTTSPSYGVLDICTISWPRKTLKPTGDEPQSRNVLSNCSRKNS
jgi:hypothetical protein